jgi:dolichol-phosphate mannosyltransferase
MTLLVVLPTYNERPNIESIVEGVLRHEFARLLVVDDGSPDGTAQAAEDLGRTRFPGRIDVLHRRGPRGFGLALADGLRKALESGADAIGQMDADLSHDPVYIPGMMTALQAHDLVIGSRYLRGISVVNWPLHRVFLSAFANRYIRFITALETQDCTSGFRIWRRDALAKMPLDRVRANGYAFLTEMLFDAARLGCRIGESPIIFIERQKGYSKVSSGVLMESLMTPWRLILRSGRVRRARR